MSLRGFDWEYYLEKYPDLNKAGINCKKKAIIHYQKYGKAENRFPNKNVELMNRRIDNRKITKINKSESSKEYDLSKKILSKSESSKEFDLSQKLVSKSESSKEFDLSSRIKECESCSEKSTLDIKNEIINIKNEINILKDLINMILKNKIIKNDNNLSPKVASFNKYDLNNEVKSISSPKIESSEKEYNLNNSKANVNNSRIESSEEYELNNNTSENLENDNIIDKYSNSEENNLNDKFYSDNFIASSDSFSKNLSYDK
jgi:hypothetical protein